MNVAIRCAVPADAAELVRLNQAFNGVETRTASDVARALRVYEQELVFVAWAEGQAVGFVCGQIQRSFCYGRPQGFITELYVEETYRRQGIASALLVAVEEGLAQEGADAFCLETGARNLPAQALYERLGYSRENHLIYRKDWPPKEDRP